MDDCVGVHDRIIVWFFGVNDWPVDVSDKTFGVLDTGAHINFRLVQLMDVNPCR